MQYLNFCVKAPDNASSACLDNIDSSFEQTRSSQIVVDVAFPQLATGIRRGRLSWRLVFLLNGSFPSALENSHWHCLTD
jgi:hypothetical protein